MSENWTVSVAQLPILGGATHLIILVRDANGAIRYEIDGGPWNATKDDLASADNDSGAYLPGARDLGARVYNDTTKFYGPSLAETVLQYGSREQIEAEVAAARSAADQINALGLPYWLVGWWGAQNSNSVASTILKVMGIPLAGNTIIAMSAPGFDQTLLTNEQMNQDRQQAGLPPMEYQLQNYDPGVPDNSLLNVQGINWSNGAPQQKSPVFTAPELYAPGGLGIVAGSGAFTAYSPVINTDGLISVAQSYIIPGNVNPARQTKQAKANDVTKRLDVLKDCFVGPGGAICAMTKAQGTKLSNIDPLVLDLNGDGITLSDWVSNTVLFDILGDGRL
ncbi:hypothetical protein FM996_20925, partial [Methylosinus sporium]